jgi:stage II sporulation protein R
MFNEFYGNKKLLGIGRRKLSRALVMAVVACVIGICIFSTSYSNSINEGLSEKLIRLHVVANSDSESDQELKRHVRDRIIDYLDNEIDKIQDVNQVDLFIRDNLDIIEKIAMEEVAAYGESYTAQAFFGNHVFPTKAYGDITLPAGNYRALKVVLGEGNGSNWWCVLFPPLCFIDVTHGTVPDYIKEDLKDTLTDEEYEIIAEADDDKDIPIRIRFKIVEFFQDTKIRFSGIISKLFDSER